MFVRERQDGFFRRNESNSSLFLVGVLKEKWVTPAISFFYFLRNRWDVVCVFVLLSCIFLLLLPFF
jgi:hypothetical protein